VDLKRAYSVCRPVYLSYMKDKPKKMGKIRQRKISWVFKTAISLEMENVETCKRPRALQYGVLLHSRTFIVIVMSVVQYLISLSTLQF